MLQLVAIYNIQLHVSTLYVGHHQFVQRCCKTRSRPHAKKVTHLLYSHLSSLDNLMKAYVQGRNM